MYTILNDLIYLEIAIVIPLYKGSIHLENN